jgi:uncharacterized surface anchored protein/uncharacterized protein (DUF433 family)
MAAILAFVAILAILTPTATLAEATNTVATVRARATISTSTLNYDGRDIGIEAVMEYNGKEYPAFCVDPVLPGAAGHPNKEYPVTIAGTNNSPRVATVLHNSVPYMSKDDIIARFPGLTDLQIYAATKAAVRAVADQTASQYPNDNLWSGDAQTVAFAKYLIDLAKNATEDMPLAAFYGTTDSSEVFDDGEYLVKTTTVLSSTYDLAESTRIRLTLSDNAPAGTIITDAADAPIPTDGVPNRTPIKIKVPKASIAAGTNGSFSVKAEFTIASDVILFGVPSDANDVENYQRYEVSIPEQTVEFSIDFPYSAAAEIPPTTEPTASPIESPSVGGLRVLKYDNVTGELAPGAVFEVQGLDDGNRHIFFQVQASADAAIPSVANGATVTVGNGTVTASGLPTGKYLITEISPPPNYDMSPDATYSRVVEVEASATATVYPQVVFRNNPYGKLKITKIDAVTGQPVANIWLRIRNPLTGLDITRKTDADGIITLDDLPQDNYELSETNAGSDYEPSDVVLVVPIRWGQLSEVTFDNQPHTSLEVTKIDAKTNKPVAGAVFTLKQLATGKEWTLTTLADGKAVANNISAGSYTVREIFVPEPLILDPTIVNIQIDNDKANKYTARNDEKPIVTIEKYDEQSGELIGGAEFRLERLDGAWRTEFMLDASGKWALTVNPGTYRFSEIAAPWGYLISTEHKDFAVGPNDEITVKFDNRPCPKLEIVKVDEAGNPLPGAVFHIGKAEGETIAELVTGANGRILLENLDESVYSVKEVKAPDGYVADANCQRDVLLEWGKTKQLIFTNIKKPELTILKLDEETKEPLFGAKFRIVETEGATIREEVTGADGKIVLTGLNPGIFSIEEIVAPSGYLLDSQHKDVELLPGDAKQVIFTNRARPKLRILKVDAITGEPLANAELRVTKVEDATVSEYKTDASGEILIENLDEAVYRAEEFMPPNGYLLYDESKEIALEWGVTKTLKFDDVRRPTLIFTKLNGLTNLPIADAVFRVDYEQADGGVATLGTFRTDADGKIILSQVNVGWYVLTEIHAASGFSLASNPVTRLYLSAGQNAYSAEETGVAATRELAATSGSDYATSADGQLTYNFPLNSIIVKKTDAVTGKLLAGAAFELYRADEQVSGVPGTAIGRYVTDNSGIIVITGLEPGYYSVREVQAPPNYLISENSPQNGFLKADGTTILEFAFANIPYGSLLITKVDALTNKPLANARFRVTDGSGAVAGSTNGEFVTDENGEILIPNLKPGAYVISEREAPPNYAISGMPQTVQIGTDGKTYKVSFSNYPFSSLLVRKLDALTREPLMGARFKVTDSSGAVAGNSGGEFVTDVNGEFLVPNLRPAGYVVTEISAPDGYAIDHAPQTIDVGADGKTYTLTFADQPLAAIVIKKYNAATREPLADAEFYVTTGSGGVVGTGDGFFATDANGIITIPNLPKNSYIVRETNAPDGFILENQTQTIAVDYGKTYTLEFSNKPKSSLQIVKIDSETKQPLKDARFTVYRANGEAIGTFDTDSDGLIILSGFEPGWLKIAEVKAPSGYRIDDTPRDVEITHNQFLKVTFENKPLASLIVKKIDDKTGAPLAGAAFRVERQDGRFAGEYTTDHDGIFTISAIDPGWYIVREQRSPDGYLLDETPKTVEVKPVTPTVVTFANKRLAALEIVKRDEKTNEPLAGARFTVERQNGERVGEYVTDGTGIISIPTLAPDFYVIRELTAPQGYLLDNMSITTEVKTDAPTVVTVTNRRLSGLQIIKQDAVTGEPLSGAKFTVYEKNGKVVGEYTTDANGVIIVDDLAPNWYKVAETTAPSGYLISEAPKDVEVTHGEFLRVIFMDERLASLQIKKIDAMSGKPLAGAVFTVSKQNSERIGDTYTTDANGFANIPNLAPDYYIVAEAKAPSGYSLDAPPQTVQIKPNIPTIVTFADNPLAGLKILKLNNVTSEPIAGAEFSISRMDGEKVENNFRQYTFVTDRIGQIYVPNLADGYYIVTETQSANGYFLDAEPRSVLVQSGKTTLLEVFNTPMSGLLIVKTDARTGAPLQGVVFDVRRADGQFVAGSILDGNQAGTAANSSNRTTSPSGDVTGSYTTDAQGRILINGLESGEYHVTERKALDGYEIDAEVHAVTVAPGKVATLQVANRQKAGLRLVKIDSVSKKPIYNVEFMLFDANGNVVGNFYTNNDGIIDFSGILTEGRYTIRETRPAQGYYPDDIPRTVIFKSGEYTEIKWENEPYLAQIQITKKSADANEVNGFDAGTPLADAVFEVSDYKTGNLVDRFMTGADGRGVSKPLPLGRYLVREVQASANYKLSDKTLDITLEFPKQIVKSEFLNFSANTGVYIRKTGNVEAMPGTEIRYDVKEVRNTSTVALTDFYWRDSLPVSAVRLTKIVTGSYNQALKYKILVTTNKGDTRIIADNLSTTRNNVVDCSAASLGLKKDEFVTSFTLIFGTVKAGFCQVETPQVYVKVLTGLQNGFQFANKVDVGGKYGKEWVVGNSTWLTIIYVPKSVPLPKTGY